MHYGLQIAASGMLTSLYRTDVFASNLANLNTTGFKPDTPFTRQRDPVRDEDGIAFQPSNEMLERLGAGAHLAPNDINFGQGNLRETGNPLDIALQGEGFIVLRDSANQGTTGLLFSRDGRLSRDSNGRLVQAATGKPVLSAQGGIITLPTGPVSISGDGVIRSNGEQIATIRLADAADRTQLKKVGDNALRPTDAALNNPRPVTAQIKQGFLEASGVNEMRTLLSLQGAARAVSGNTRMIQYHDRMIDGAINRLGRTA